VCCLNKQMGFERDAPERNSRLGPTSRWAGPVSPQNHPLTISPRGRGGLPKMDKTAKSFFWGAPGDNPIRNFEYGF